jgi:hypothetical protein
MSHPSLVVSLDALVYQKAGRRRRRKQPYLWTTFFKIDGGTITLSKQFQLTGQAAFHFGPGSHGNLATQVFEPGDAIPIPPAIGQWQTELLPISVPFFNYEMPGMIGVVAVLMQENNVSDIGAEAGHEALNRYIEEAVGDAIRSFDVKHIDVENIQPSLKQYFAGQVAALTDGIEAQVKDAIVEAQSWWQNLWTLIEADELVGYCVWDLLSIDIPAGAEGLPLQQHWVHDQLGTWELQGKVTKSTDSTPRQLSTAKP